jgi:eukaryotic-like serine/threonine-protein kinase
MAGSETTARLIGERYALETPLGRGGMGVVWRAHDDLLKRTVAVKEVLVPPTMPPDERASLEQRVLREARAAAGLNHPSVVAVYDVMQDEGQPFIVMELVDAPTLAGLVDTEGPLTPERAAEVGLDILTALELAHEKGIVHRDVKPGNVMVPPTGVAKLADFGIAAVTGDPKLTASGMILGSPSFMAPEQATDSKSTPATDVWALGAVLYFAVEGKPPFDKGQPIPTLTAVLHDDPEIDPQVAGALAPAIRAALQKEPAARPTTGELRPLLQAAAGGTMPATPPMPEITTVPSPQPAPESVTPTAPRSRPIERPARPRAGTALWVAIGLFAVAALVLGGLLLFNQPADDPRTETNRDQATQEGPSEETGGALPTGFTTFTDDEIGYTAAYPEEWSVSDPGKANATDFRDDATGTYLRVDWVQPPNGTPEGAWEAAAATSGFDTIRIDPTTYKGMDAALWEYTYSEGGADLHAYNLGFITPDETYGMALNFQTHEENWDSSQELWEQLKASFKIPN